jgi:acyl-CoA thioesterase
MSNKPKENMAPSIGPHAVEIKPWISCAPFDRLLNITIVEAAAGRAILTMPFYIDYAQGAGLMHGGALVSLADTAVAMAIKSIVSPSCRFVTTELHSRFLFPVTRGVVTARAEIFENKGKHLKGRATLYDDAERAVMEFSSTFRVSEDVQIISPGPI